MPRTASGGHVTHSRVSDWNRSPGVRRLRVAAPGQGFEGVTGGGVVQVRPAGRSALEPQLLILDEPTASLDPASSREVERIIGDIAAAGARILMTTHNLGQAHRLGEEIVFIDRGRVVEQTPVEQFFKLPRTDAAQRFLTEEIP